MGKPTKILHNVAVGVVLNDVLDPLIAVLISATLRFSRMASSGLGNVDLSEVLFALENVDESPEIWVVCSYIRLWNIMIWTRLTKNMKNISTKNTKVSA